MKTLWTCFVVAMSLLVAGVPQTGQNTLDERLAKLTKDDWRGAAALGDQLAGLPGHEGYEWLKKNWSKAPHVTTRQQFLKSFAFSSNVDALKVLDLGMKDSSTDVQGWSIIYLKGIAFEDYSLDFSKYAPWAKKNLEKSVADARNDSLEVYVQRLNTATGKELDSLLQLCEIDSIRQAKAQPRALSVVIKILGQQEISDVAQRALEGLLVLGKPDESFVRTRLLPLLKDERIRVKAAAIKALGDVKQPWALEELCSELKSVTSKSVELMGVMELAEAIASYRDQTKIPFLIAIIESHNGYETVYEVGHFGLGPLTDVRYEDSHDGAWWRTWWEKNKERFAENVRSLKIPDLPKSAGYKPTDKPELALADLDKAIKAGEVEKMDSIMLRLVMMRAVQGVPTLVAVMVADNTQDTLRPMGEAMSHLAGVQYEKSHDGPWWKSWWETNKGRYKDDAPTGALPQVKMGPKKPGNERVPGGADVDDIPTTNNFVGGDRDKRYIVSGPLPGSKMPEAGQKLFIVLPGGDGSADFHPFLKRVLRNSLGNDYLLVQLVARRWQMDTENWIVWPTAQIPVVGMKFKTEEFIEDVIADVKKKHKVDAKSVFICGWSSSGPGIYPYLLGKTKSVTGAFISMAIFNDGLIPQNEGDLNGFPIMIMHSPEDFIPIVQAEKAKDYFQRKGAKVLYQTYSGGHGWRGDIFGYFTTARNFLEGKK